jgi:hypothetical protein
MIPQSFSVVASTAPREFGVWMHAGRPIKRILARSCRSGSLVAWSPQGGFVNSQENAFFSQPE